MSTSHGSGITDERSESAGRHRAVDPAARDRTIPAADTAGARSAPIRAIADRCCCWCLAHGRHRLGLIVVPDDDATASTVLKANTVLSAKTAAVRGGEGRACARRCTTRSRCTAQCDEEVTPKPLIRVVVRRSAACRSTRRASSMGYASTVLGDQLRQYGLAVNRGSARRSPPALKGSKYASTVAGRPTGSASPRRSVREAGLDPGDPGTGSGCPYVADTSAERSGPGSRGTPCRPASGVARCTSRGGTWTTSCSTAQTFFASGIYYFEGEGAGCVGGADVVGRVTAASQGCATSQEAVFFADPPLPPGQTRTTSRGSARPGCSAATAGWSSRTPTTQPLRFEFNRRYVDDPKSDPSLFVSIASVNGTLDGAGRTRTMSDPRTSIDGADEHAVMVGTDSVGSPVYELPISHEMTPCRASTSVARSLRRHPSWPLRWSSGHRARSGTATNGGAYVTWQAPPVARRGADAPLDTVRGVRPASEATGPRCTVSATTGARLEAAPVTGLAGTSSGTSHTFDVVAYNSKGASVPASVTIMIKTSTSGSPAQTPQHVSPSGLGSPGRRRPPPTDSAACSECRSPLRPGRARRRSGTTPSQRSRTSPAAGFRGGRPARSTPRHPTTDSALHRQGIEPLDQLQVPCDRRQPVRDRHIDSVERRRADDGYGGTRRPTATGTARGAGGTAGRGASNRDARPAFDGGIKRQDPGLHRGSPGHGRGQEPERPSGDRDRRHSRGQDQHARR